MKDVFFFNRRFRYVLTGYSTTVLRCLFNQRVVFLKALYSTFTTVSILYSFNALYRSERTCNSSDIRNLVLQTSVATLRLLT